MGKKMSRMDTTATRTGIIDGIFQEGIPSEYIFPPFLKFKRHSFITDIERVLDIVTYGSFNELKSVLKNKSQKEIETLVSSAMEEYFPLTSTYNNGHMDVIAFLVNKCHAKINQTCCIELLSGRIENATPLFCAVYKVNLELMRTLGSANNFQKCSMSPLLAAVSCGFLDIVKFLIQHGADTEIPTNSGKTCLMIACMKENNRAVQLLLKNGADIKRRDAKGRTALHYSADYGNLNIVKVLLRYGAVHDHDSLGITPMLYAAMSGYTEIVTYFMKHYGFAESQVIDVFQILGATEWFKNQDRVRACSYWEKAMLCQCEVGLNEPYPPSSLSSYLDVAEAHTSAQLEEVKSCSDRMTIQALLVLQRIVGLRNFKDAEYISIGRSISNLNIKIQLWICNVESLQQCEEPQYDAIHKYFMVLIEVFFYVMQSYQVYPKNFYQSMVHVFKMIVNQVDRILQLPLIDRPDKFLHRILVTAVCYIGLLCQLKSNEFEDIELKRYIYKLVHINPATKKGLTLLHFACGENKLCPLFRYSYTNQFPFLKVVNLLLEMNASPNVADLDQNTPLHFAAGNRPFACHVFMSLLKHGAHLDCHNRERQTPLQLVPENLIDLNPFYYINLQCLCARSIRTNDVPYKGWVDKELQKFLDLH